MLWPHSIGGKHFQCLVWADRGCKPFTQADQLSMEAPPFSVLRNILANLASMPLRDWHPRHYILRARRVRVLPLPLPLQSLHPALPASDISHNCNPYRSAPVASFVALRFKLLSLYHYRQFFVVRVSVLKLEASHHSKGNCVLVRNVVERSLYICRHHYHGKLTKRHMSLAVDTWAGSTATSIAIRSSSIGSSQPQHR
jgi:hypothetical protein